MFNQATIELRPSLQLTLFFTVFFGLIGVVLLALAMPVWLKLSLSALLGAHFVFTVGQYALLTWPTSVIKIRYEKNGDEDVKVRLFKRNQRELDTRLHGDTCVTPIVTLLVCRTGWRDLVFLVRDNCDPDAFRRFRVCLRFARN
ncbi:hypothetical protein EUZ85_24380 [Hahella sp. KA22]|uniref:protein YgfX n=1 Tax=Hahella sp. KA22 TaxID=1628392 RepID=UPI000FDD493B|nr:protein YgfX [Hahella sp. KA22]AZZ93688.1 hypothetical protein ENC22_21795 [Hahella sp. KA22]QAY57063.1 hypothetical protein EUZ85_24380 [Hahella sp. KA22]